MTTKVTVSTKGHLIDPECSYNNNGVILESNGSVYDCTLNQTDIDSNKNKFYIMQIIKVGKGKEYVVYIRFGRVGVAGKTSYKIYLSESPAISFFEKQFRAKTGNNWHDRNDFIKKPGKYFMAELELVDVSDEEDTNSSKDSSENEDDELDGKVIDFLKLISNTTYMKNTLIQLEIDTEKMPLGKISQNQIDKAYEIINEINQNIGK